MKYLNCQNSPKTKKSTTAGPSFVLSSYSEVDNSSDILTKVQNAICQICQICQEQDLKNSTKYTALTVFLRLLNQQCQNTDFCSDFIVCAIRLSAKCNSQCPQIIKIFEQTEFIQKVGCQRSLIEIMRLETEYYCLLDFDIVKKSPYDFLEGFNSALNLTSKFKNMVIALIDFSLSLIQISNKSSQQIFAGCLYVTKINNKITDRNVIIFVEEYCRWVQGAEEIGQLIWSAWQKILGDDS